MLTSAIVTTAKKDFPDWSRTSILSFLNEIQNMIFCQDTTVHMQMYGSTGKDPVLTTTAGTYEYTISTANGFSENSWRVTSVYSVSIDDPEDVILKDASPGGYATVIFKSDPGSTDFYIRSYRFPTQLSIESTQLEIPASYHITHVYEGLIGLIEKARSGKSDRWEKFEKLLLPDIKTRLSRTQSSYYVPYRGY